MPFHTVCLQSIPNFQKFMTNMTSSLFRIQCHRVLSKARELCFEVPWTMLQFTLLAQENVVPADEDHSKNTSQLKDSQSKLAHRRQMYTNFIPENRFLRLLWMMTPTQMTTSYITQAMCFKRMSIIKEHALLIIKYYSSDLQF